jgi:hypothetical protein
MLKQKNSLRVIDPTTGNICWGLSELASRLLILPRVRGPLGAGGGEQPARGISTGTM